MILADCFDSRLFGHFGLYRPPPCRDEYDFTISRAAAVTSFAAAATAARQMNNGLYVGVVGGFLSPAFTLIHA